jgi:aquaporin Z
LWRISYFLLILKQKHTIFFQNIQKFTFMRRYVNEFIGTFFMVLTIIISDQSKATGVIPALAIGSMITALIFAGGHISGAHYNPVVSLAMLIRKRMNVNDFTYYIAAQVAGAVSASLISAVLLPAIVGSKPDAAHSLDIFPALLAEFLGTFILVWVIQNVATAKGTEGNSFYGLAIGLTITGLIFTFGPISGAVFNPAVAVACCIAEMSTWQDLWILLLGSIVGGAVAAGAYQNLVGENR